MPPEAEIQQPNTLALALPLSEVTYRKDPYNIIEHDKKNLDAIEESVSETGFGRGVVFDEYGTVLVGNGTMEIAKKTNAKLLIVDVEDPNTLVVTRRLGLTERQKRRMALWDNRASDLHKYNKQAVARLNEAHPEQQLLVGVFSEREQEKMLRMHADAQMLAPGGTDEDTEVKSGIDVGMRPESGVRMVSIFCDQTTQPIFVRKARELSSLFGTTTISDALIAIVNRAHAEWLPKEDSNDSELGTSSKADSSV